MARAFHHGTADGSDRLRRVGANVGPVDEPATDAASERSSAQGVSSALAITALVLVILAGVGLVLFNSPMFKPTVATITFPGLDAPAEHPLRLAAGARVGFGMTGDEIAYEGPDYIRVRVELLREGSVVATMRCRAFELEGDGGDGGGQTHYNSDCEVTAPAGGSTAVRAVASKEGDGSLRVRGLRLLAYRP